MTATVAALLARVGIGYLVPVVLGAVLVGAALRTVAGARTASPRAVTVAALAGSLAVIAQVALARQSPGTPAAFLLGTLGGTLWYAAAVWRHEGRPLALCRVGLAVGALLWIAGTITVTVSLTAAGWPLVGSVVIGVAVPGALVLASWRRAESESGATRRLRQWAALGAAFVLPAAVGGLVGPAVLFVSYLVVFATAVIVWSLCRLAFE